MKKTNVACYGNYASKNYGISSLLFTDPKGNQFYFSYDTLVAFHTCKTGLVCHVNDWGTTTGKHLNWIQPNHKQRVSHAEFERLYAEAFPEEEKGKEAQRD